MSLLLELAKKKIGNCNVLRGKSGQVYDRDVGGFALEGEPGAEHIAEGSIGVGEDYARSDRPAEVTKRKTLCTIIGQYDARSREELRR